MLKMLKMLIVLCVSILGALTVLMSILRWRDGESPLGSGQGSADGGEVVEHEVGL